MLVKKEKQTTENMQIRPDDRLVGVTKQYHARRSKAFICEDKLNNYLIMSQCLSDIVNSINAIVPDKSDQVSLPGLYQGLGKSFFAKHRWKVVPFDLEIAAEAFESARHRFDNNLIVGAKDSYHIQYAS